MKFISSKLINIRALRNNNYHYYNLIYKNTESTLLVLFNTAEINELFPVYSVTIVVHLNIDSNRH